MRWSAVIAGAVLSLGVWILLQTLGTGIGLSAVDTDDVDSLRGVGIGTGVWSVIAPLIALFVGAMLAGRLAGTREPRMGAIHGSVHWALTAIAGTYVVASIIMGLASGVSSVGKAAISESADAGPEIMSKLGLGGDEMLAPINAKLRAQGKPEVTVNELQRTMSATASRGMREGTMSREMFAEELARNTGLSRRDVDDIAGQVQPQISRAGDRATDAALEAADKTGKGLLMAGLALLLGLAASIGGGALGARMSTRHDRKDDDFRGGGMVGTTTAVGPAVGPVGPGNPMNTTY